MIRLPLQKPPLDPLAGVPEQPDVETDAGFKREHDRNFEQQWHVVALQRDETETAAEERIRMREEVRHDYQYTPVIPQYY